MKKSPTELINLTFSGLMVLLTLTGAIIFLFTDLLSDKAFGSKRIILGVVFLSYAIYRSYRIYSVFKNKH
jgi:Na+/phosphate symporter